MVLCCWVCYVLACGSHVCSSAYLYVSSSVYCHVTDRLVLLVRFCTWPNPQACTDVNDGKVLMSLVIDKALPCKMHMEEVIKFFLDMYYLAGKWPVSKCSSSARQLLCIIVIVSLCMYV